MKCGANLASWTQGGKDTSAAPAAISWSAAGKITVIRCPVSKNKEKYEGDWVYEFGTMFRRVLFKKELIDLRQQLVKVEMAPEFIKTLAGYKKAVEITPGSFTVLAANPVLAESYQERKREALSRMVLTVIHLKNSWFYAYTNAEIYAELVRNGKPSCS